MREIVRRDINVSELFTAVCAAKKGYSYGIEDILKNLKINSKRRLAISNFLLGGNLNYQKLYLLLKYEMKDIELDALLSELSSSDFNITYEMIEEILKKEFIDVKQIKSIIDMYRSKISKHLMDIISQNYIPGDKMNSLLEKCKANRLSYYELTYFTSEDIIIYTNNVDYSNLLTIISSLHSIEIPGIISSLLSWMENNKEKKEEKINISENKLNRFLDDLPREEQAQLRKAIANNVTINDINELDIKSYTKTLKDSEYQDLINLIISYKRIGSSDTRKLIRDYILESKELWSNNVLQFPNMGENSRKNPYQKHHNY